MSKKVIVGGIALTVALATLGTSVVFAQGPSGPGDGGRFGPQGGPSSPGGFGWGIGDGIFWEQMRSKVAELLGLSTDELDDALQAGATLRELAEEQGMDLSDLSAAMSTYRQEAIAAAVEDGSLTAPQAEWLLGRTHMWGAGIGLHMGWGVYASSNQDEVIADALGISLGEFQAAREEGKTLADLADELNVDLENVREAVQDAREQALSEAVDTGRISSEQAEWMADHGPMGMGPGQGAGRGRFGGSCFSTQ
jgi:hypothetical protein